MYEDKVTSKKIILYKPWLSLITTTRAGMVSYYKIIPTVGEKMKKYRYAMLCAVTKWWFGLWQYIDSGLWQYIGFSCDNVDVGCYNMLKWVWQYIILGSNNTLNWVVAICWFGLWQCVDLGRDNILICDVTICGLWLYIELVCDNMLILVVTIREVGYIANLSQSWS